MTALLWELKDIMFIHSFVCLKNIDCVFSVHQVLFLCLGDGCRQGRWGLYLHGNYILSQSSWCVTPAVTAVTKHWTTPGDGQQSALGMGSKVPWKEPSAWKLDWYLLESRLHILSAEFPGKSFWATVLVCKMGIIMPTLQGFCKDEMRHIECKVHTVGPQ